MKREVLELRRAVVPLVAPMRRLTEGYSRSCRRRCAATSATSTTTSPRWPSASRAFDELLTTLVDAVLAKITLRQNNDMRKITAYAALLAVPTMLAGIYGMNFDYMPELHWRVRLPAGAADHAPVLALFRDSAATAGSEPLAAAGRGGGERARYRPSRSTRSAACTAPRGPSSSRRGRTPSPG